jgi:hypothetical protein
MMTRTPRAGRLPLALAALGALTLAACATPTPYQPSADGSSYGYTEQQIEAERLRLSFRGNSLTERETVENYLLFRAAEVAIERGYDHFIIVDRDTQTRTRIQSVGGSARLSSLYYFHPRIGWRPFYDPFFDDVTFREVTRYEAVAEVVLGRGPKPADDPNAYDAREVQANLGPLITRPAGG